MPLKPLTISMQEKDMLPCPPQPEWCDCLPKYLSYTQILLCLRFLNHHYTNVPDT